MPILSCKDKEFDELCKMCIFRMSKLCKEDNRDIKLEDVGLKLADGQGKSWGDVDRVELNYHYDNLFNLYFINKYQ